MNLNDMRGRITQPTLLVMHILAGRSILTLRSKRSGGRLTFRFSRPDEVPGRPRPIWVSVYGGPEGGYLNEGTERSSWSFIGTIWSGLDTRFTRSAKSKLNDDDPAVLTAAWIAAKLDCADVLMEQGEWWHEGICGRCGRRLTVPESIESGFGPECRKAVGL